MAGSTTLLTEDGTAHELAGPPDAVDPDALERATGWALKPEGLCRGEVCVALLGRRVAGGDGRIDLLEWAGALRQPAAVDARHAVVAVVPAPGDPLAAGGPAPDVELPDLTGQPVSFSRFTGRKRVLLAWASW